MANDEDLKASGMIGCVSGVLALIITLPIWYVLLFGILVRTDAPAWQWVLYWIYIPSSVVIHGISEFAKFVARAGD